MFTTQGIVNITQKVVMFTTAPQISLLSFYSVGVAQHSLDLLPLKLCTANSLVEGVALSLVEGVRGSLSG